MNILGLIEKILNSRGNNEISVSPDFCVRLKTPMAGCYECINKCPDLSIKITGNDLTILENCSKCNACIYICPNSVFYIKGDDSQERQVSFPLGDSFYYFCVKAVSALKAGMDKKLANNIKECVYALEDIDIISAIKNGNKISFVTEECKTCNLIYFHNKKLKRITGIKKFFKRDDAFLEINIKDFDLPEFLERQNLFNAGKNKEDKNEGENCGGEAEILDRRAFFKNSIKGIKNNAKRIMGDISLEDLPLSELYSAYIDSGANSGEKKINKLLLKRQSIIYRFLKNNAELLPLFNIRLPKINQNCVFCSNCWELCPTAALNYKEKEGKIILEPFLCTGCNMCKDICSFGAVRMYKAKKIKDISGKRILLKRTEYEV